MSPCGQGEVQISPIGLIPKKNRPNKFRMIVDLSSPEGGSVNEGIQKEWSSVVYTSVDHLAILIGSMGLSNCVMVKADVKEAYRMVPVHPGDKPLLGLQWQGDAWLDTVLPLDEGQLQRFSWQ